MKEVVALHCCYEQYVCSKKKIHVKNQLRTATELYRKTYIGFPGVYLRSPCLCWRKLVFALVAEKALALLNLSLDRDDLVCWRDLFADSKICFSSGIKFVVLYSNT